MSFSDLLKQPLPSKSDMIATESVDIDKIKDIITDSKELVEDYNKSRKSINDSLKVIRAGIQQNKFAAAKNSIKALESRVNKDRNDIEKRIKSLESRGLTEKKINVICAGMTVGLAGAAAAGHIVRNKYKDAQDDKPGKTEYADYSKYMDDTIEAEKKYSKARHGTQLSDKQISDNVEKFKKLKEEELKKLEDRTKKAEKAEKAYDRTRFGLVGAGITAASVTSCFMHFSKVKNSYETFYDTVLATLKDLTTKCDEESKDIKECLIDYVVLSNDIQLLMESAESDIGDEEYSPDPDADSDSSTSPANTEECGDNCSDKCSNNAMEYGDDDIEEDIDISDMSDADLDELEDELADSDVEDITDGIEEVDLTPEEEREADDFMSLAATTELVRDELSATERAEFYSDPVQAQIAVVEGFMLESDFADGQMVTEKFFNKTRVQFSKEDRKHQLFAVALNASARAHNDPDYIKLQKVQQMRRVLKARIRKKYRSEAVRRVKVYMQRLKASKSNILSKIGKKLHKDNKG